MEQQYRGQRVDVQKESVGQEQECHDLYKQECNTVQVLPPSFQNKSAKMFLSKSVKLIMERSSRFDMDSSVTPTMTKSIPSKMKRIIG